MTTFDCLHVFWFCGERDELLLLFVLQETEAASMTDLERKNLRRAMYSRDVARTEEDEEGERKA